MQVYGTFVQSTYEDKGKGEVYVLFKKFSHVTFSPREDRVQVSHVLDSDSNCTDIRDSKRQQLFHTDSELGDSFLLETRFNDLSNPIGMTFKFVWGIEISTKQSDVVAESESNNKSKGVAPPPLGPMSLV